MVIRNTGGNTADYNLGRGIVYFDGDQPAGYSPGWRDVGNCPEFNISLESETKEHQSFLSGLKVIDQETLISQKMSVSFTLEEMNFNNLALFTLGFKGGVAATGNPLINASIVASASVGWLQPNVYIEGIYLGTWYDLELVPALLPNEKRRGYDFEAGQIRSGVTKDVRFNPANRTDTAGGTGLTERTASVPNGDFELDRRLGRIRFFAGGPGNVAPGPANRVLVAWQDAVTRPSATGFDNDLESVAALATSGYRGRLKLIAVNPANNNQPYEWLFHDVNLRPDGDLPLIGDEFQQMTLTGTLQAVSAAPYGLSRYMDLVTRRSWATG
jgi:hypothetical protein